MSTYSLETDTFNGITIDPCPFSFRGNRKGKCICRENILKINLIKVCGDMYCKYYNFNYNFCENVMCKDCKEDPF